MTFTERLNELVTFYGDHKRMTSHRKTFWNQTKTTCMPIKQHLHTISMNEYHESSYIYIYWYTGEKNNLKKKTFTYCRSKYIPDDELSFAHALPMRIPVLKWQVRSRILFPVPGGEVLPCSGCLYLLSIWKTEYNGCLTNTTDRGFQYITPVGDAASS